MNTLLISIAVATLGIDVGWQRLPEGGMQYVIQLDPQALDALRAGQPIESDIPAGAGDVRSYRIIVGKGTLRRDLPPPRSTLSNAPGAQSTAGRGPALLVPPTVEPPRSVKPSSGQPAIFEEPEGKPAVAKPQPQAATKPAPQEPSKPWLPLMLTLFGLFGSLGANVYLGWLAVEFRRRCRALMLSATAP
jgi:hypothetical protein